VTAGDSAQFLSSVVIDVPAKDNHSAVVGRIMDGYGDPLRTFEPYLNINAFVRVRLEVAGSTVASVVANNQGHNGVRILDRHRRRGLWNWRDDLLHRPWVAGDLYDGSELCGL
jgi:hypothetical protein